MKSTFSDPPRHQVVWVLMRVCAFVCLRVCEFIGLWVCLCLSVCGFVVLCVCMSGLFLALACFWIVYCIKALKDHLWVLVRICGYMCVFVCIRKYLKIFVCIYVHTSKWYEPHE